MKEVIRQYNASKSIQTEEQFRFFSKPYAKLVINLLIIPEFIYLSKIISLVTVFNSYYKRVEGNIQFKLIGCLVIIFGLFFLHGYFLKSVRYAKRVTYLQEKLKACSNETDHTTTLSPTLEEIRKEYEGK